MKFKLPRTLLFVFALTLSLSSFSNGQSPITSWEEVYDPLTVRNLNVRITAVDWQTILADTTYEIEVPAIFWMDGEDIEHQILIRRKSATPIGTKVSFKIDFKSNRWHDIKKLSLENGDDNNVVSEGLSWYLHRLASNENYQPGLAAWSNLIAHVEGVDENENPTLEILPQGLYLNVEQPDKHFLRHRGLWNSATTFFYKQSDIGSPELKETPNRGNSPAYNALTYSPFRETTSAKGKRTTSTQPSDATIQADLLNWINMDSMLRVGAVNAYTDNPDELFNKGKNFYWVDFTTDSGDYRRLYFPWDLDSSIRGTTAGIYGSLSINKRKVSVSQHPYQQVILNHPYFRVQYNSTMLSLIDGPMSAGIVTSFLTQLEGVLTPHLLADPNSKVGSTESEVSGFFQGLRDWVFAREANVRMQLGQNGPPAPRQ
jgi:hypothetical protein